MIQAFLYGTTGNPILVDPITKALGGWLQDINIASISIRLVMAIILAAIIGLDRANQRQAAGLRTYILVSLGACVAMITNQFIRDTYLDQNVSRLGAQVISGIGFLGAGTIIITSRNRVKGLTTAAGLWAVACVGLAIGIGFYTLSLLAYLLILISLKVLPKFEMYFTMRTKLSTVHVELSTRKDLKILIEYIRNDLECSIKNISNNPAYSKSGICAYTLIISNNEKEVKSEEIIKKIADLDIVGYVERIL